MARHANVEKALLKPIYVRFQSDVARVLNSGIEPQGHLLCLHDAGPPDVVGIHCHQNGSSSYPYLCPLIISNPDLFDGLREI